MRLIEKTSRKESGPKINTKTIIIITEITISMKISTLNTMIHQEKGIPTNLGLKSHMRDLSHWPAVINAMLKDMIEDIKMITITERTMEVQLLTIEWMLMPTPRDITISHSEESKEEVVHKWELSTNQTIVNKNTTITSKISTRLKKRFTTKQVQEE